MKKKYTFGEILDFDWLRDYADGLKNYLPRPFGGIVWFFLRLIRILMILLLLFLCVAICAGAVFGAISLMIIGEDNLPLFVLGVSILYIGMNVINYCAVYKWHRRREWYFWANVFLTTIVYFYALSNVLII